ncbi:MAG TPA: STAS domain-containing protein [Tepidisphaeraceae bacterium]|nr:STAS domain-containing protein [Tepidisphaeraceae bacterium]
MIEQRAGGEHPLIVIVSEPGPGQCVVALRGDLGLAQERELDRALNSLTVLQGVVVIDLSEVGMIASLAMGALVAAQRGLRAHGAQMRLAAPHPRVLEALKRVRLDMTFGVYATVEQALAA